MYRKFGKRVLDIVLSIFLIIVLSPLYLLLAVYVRIFLGSPVLFSQERIGKNEKVFKLYKFRSMTNEMDEDGNLLGEQERLTKPGIILRSTSLDELPELFCVLAGKMSFVGPRPLPVYYGSYFLEKERVRHNVPGGLIPPEGLCGETTPSWEEQFKYDVYYVERISFFLDIKVFFATFRILFKRVKNNYGAEERPHLNEYRKEMNAKQGDGSGMPIRHNH